MKLEGKLTIREKYGPAMEITDRAEAEEYFKACVEHMMDNNPQMSQEEAIKIEKSNLGYFAGYCDQETRERVESLFNAVHPIFGPAEIKRTPEEILKLGMEMGNKAKQ